MDKSAIFIDAGYLQKILQKHGNTKIDFSKLSKELGNESNLLRTYYYTCMPYQSNPPKPQERKLYSNVNKFLNHLRKIPRYEVKLGRLQRLSNNSGISFIQKGVDMMLGVDLVKMSTDKQIQKAIIMTSDSDFVYAIQAVKDAGVTATLYYSNLLAVNRSLLDVVDESFIFDQKLIDKIKFDSQTTLTSS